MEHGEQIAALRAKAARCRRLLSEVPDQPARAALLRLAQAYESEAEAQEQRAVTSHGPFSRAED